MNGGKTHQGCRSQDIEVEIGRAAEGLSGTVISLVTRLYIYDSLVEWGEPLNGMN